MSIFYIFPNRLARRIRGQDWFQHTPFRRHIQDEDQIKSIFFDAGGTLLYIHPSVGKVYAGVTREMGVEVSDERIEERLHAAAEEILELEQFCTPEKIEAVKETGLPEHYQVFLELLEWGGSDLEDL